MKNTTPSFLLLFVAICLITGSNTAFAQVTAFTYQGRLEEAGNPANGNYDLRFSVWSSSSGPPQIAGTVTNTATAVSNGLFLATLDFGAGVFTGGERWFEIGIRTNGAAGAFTILAPRQRITSLPYAIQAATATTAATAGVAASANSVSAANISGTISDARLSPNVARLNVPNTATQATGVPTVTSGFITGASVTSGGSGYLTPPAVTVIDTTGSGTIVTANISGGAVISFTVQNPGSGYSSSAALTVASPPSNAYQVFASPTYFSGPGYLTNAESVFAGSGVGLTSLNAASLNTGTVADARLSTNVALLNAHQAFAGSNTFNNPGNSFTGDGSGLTGLNASSITSGTIPDGHLPANVARLDGAQTFSGPVNFSSLSNVFAGTFSGNGAGVTNVSLATINSAGVIAAKPNPVLFPAASLAVGAVPRSVAAADVNGDGHPDLISANLNANTISVLINNRSAEFTLSSSPGVGDGPQSVAAADVNGDDRIDLISANANNNTLSVLTNDGSGNYTLSSSPAVGINPYSVVAADVNGDGRADLISGNFGAATLSVLTNDGSGAFTLAATLTVGNGPHHVTAADVNGDGRNDLISVATFIDALTVLTNNGSGIFTLSSSLPLGSGAYPLWVTARDVNGDGRNDLISANFGLGTVSVLTNNGIGGFILASSPSTGGLWPHSIAAADVNGDNRIDLVCANQGSATLSVLTNAGRGSFTLASTLGVGLGPSSVTAADLNGDGFSDFISANQGDGLSVLLQIPFHFFGNFQGNFSGNFTGNVGIGTLFPATRLTVFTPPAEYGIEHTDGTRRLSTYVSTTGAWFGTRSAHPLHLFVNDGSSPSVTVATTGNVGIGTATPSQRLHVFGNILATGTITPSSDRNAKTGMSPVDSTAILERVAKLSIQQWRFKAEADHVKHIGPMAQDFHAAFGLGAHETAIATVDADGVALAAIQGLNRKLEEQAVQLHGKDAELQSLKERLAELEKLVAKLLPR